MSLNGILSSALTALQTNTAALRVVSNNVANMNTPGYARRVVNQQVLVTGGQLQGVSIADIQRTADQFLTQETLSANSASQQFSTQSTIFDQLNGMLGQPGDGTALTTQLDNIYAALGNAALAPNSSASRQGILNSFQSLAGTISNLSTSLNTLQQQVDQQVGTTIGSVNGKTITCDNIIVAQGHFGTTNNWWMGGPGMKGAHVSLSGATEQTCKIAGSLLPAVVVLRREAQAR